MLMTLLCLVVVWEVLCLVVVTGTTWVFLIDLTRAFCCVERQAGADEQAQQQWSSACTPDHLLCAMRSGCTGASEAHHYGDTAV